MYIYNKSHIDSEQTEIGTMNTEQASTTSSHLHPRSHQQLTSPPHPSSALPRRPSNTTSSTSKAAAASHRPSKSRRHSLPFAFPPLFFQPPNSSSASLIPSTAEGRPIPLDDTTAAHRTSALRELNSTYPSPNNRHRTRYAKSSGAQSSTYSQPVIVRTYSGPSPSQGSYGARSHHYRPSSTSRGGSRRVPLPSSSRAHSFVGSGGPVKPTISSVSSAQGNGVPSAGKHGRLVSMPRAHAKKSKPIWQWPSASRRDHDEAKLPPVEAFSFKSFMAELEPEDGSPGGGIGADLDRIAEICARSRYSLSNQYEVHVAPHGSGAAFLATAGPSSSSGRRRGNNGSSQAHAMGGPTLQAINSDDDDHTGRGHRKRRSGARRRSVAYGTLETIMSSSRSSEEEKVKKKSAAEIAEEVRGRAMRKDPGRAGSGSGSGSGSTALGESGSGSGPQPGPIKNLARKKSASFATAVMDNNTRHAGQSDVTSPRGSASALVSEPARPQTSSSHLQTRTAPDDGGLGNIQPATAQSAELLEAVAGLLPHAEDLRPLGGGPGSWGSWIPWRGAGTGGTSPTRDGKTSHAEGSLRQLLKTIDGKDKGKAVEEDDWARKSPDGA